MAVVGVIPLGLPWHSHLSSEVPAGAEGNNVIEGVELEFTCRGAKGPGIFKGTISTLVKQENPEPQCGGSNPHMCALFEYGAESSLSGESGTVTLTGVDKIEGRAGARRKLNIRVCNCNQR